MAGDTVVRIDTIRLAEIDVSGGAREEIVPDPIPHDTIRPIQLSDLLVEILRAPMSLEAVPFAVSVLEQEVGRTGRSDSSIEEALQGLPGVQIHNRFNDAVGERVSIRGYGARSEFGVRGVQILVDGIPATLPDGQSTLDHLDLGSLGRVEALRGPGSALYGNAAGGVLHFETRQPSDSPFRQEVRAIEGDHGYRRTQSTTSGRVGEVGYLLNLARYEFGGYRANPLVETGPGDPPRSPPFRLRSPGTPEHPGQCSGPRGQRPGDRERHAARRGEPGLSLAEPARPRGPAGLSLQRPAAGRKGREPCPGGRDLGSDRRRPHPRGHGLRGEP
jgi:outer membrane receptor protein involved in Fe transport